MTGKVAIAPPTALIEADKQAMESKLIRNVVVFIYFLCIKKRSLTLVYVLSISIERSALGKLVLARPLPSFKHRLCDLKTL